MEQAYDMVTIHLGYFSKVLSYWCLLVKVNIHPTT
jgi:hypothetical protein